MLLKHMSGRRLWPDRKAGLDSGLDFGLHSGLDFGLTFIDLKLVND